MATKMNPKSSGSASQQEDIRDIIPAFPEPQAYPSGWDVTSLVPPAAPPNSVSKSHTFAPK